MNTAIVILNWNGRKFLEKFLPGLYASVQQRRSDGADDAVIIADNASTDGSIEWLSEHYPDIRTIILDRNYGFTGGYNRALAQIEAEYFLLLNSDIEVTDGWLEPLEHWLDNHPLCGAVAPKLLSYDDREMFEYAGAAGGRLDKYGYPFCRGRVMKQVEKDYGQYDEPENVLWASGACLMVRAELYRRLGGLDERFFAHQEEIDLCWRMQLEGYDITVVPESKVYHVGGGTLPNDSPWKLELNYRNNLLMLSNNLAKTYALEFFNENYIEPETAELEREDSEAEKIAKKAVRVGFRRASGRIRRRKALDLCSAAVYLLTGRWACFKAVVKAHGDYRKMLRRPSRQEVYAYLLDKGKIAGVEGLYPRWIIPAALIHGKDIFSRIKRDMY